MVRSIWLRKSTVVVKLKCRLMVPNATDFEFKSVQRFLRQFSACTWFFLSSVCFMGLEFILGKKKKFQPRRVLFLPRQIDNSKLLPLASYKCFEIFNVRVDFLLQNSTKINHKKVKRKENILKIPY